MMGRALAKKSSKRSVLLNRRRRDHTDLIVTVQPSVAGSVADPNDDLDREISVFDNEERVSATAIGSSTDHAIFAQPRDPQERLLSAEGDRERIRTQICKCVTKYLKTGHLKRSVIILLLL